MKIRTCLLSRLCTFCVTKHFVHFNQKIKVCNQNILNVDLMIDTRSMIFFCINQIGCQSSSYAISVHEFIKRSTIKTAAAVAAASKKRWWLRIDDVCNESLSFCSIVFYSLKWFHFRTATSSSRRSLSNLCVEENPRFTVHINDDFLFTSDTWMWDDDLRHVIPMREYSSIAYTVYCQYFDGSYKDYWRVYVYKLFYFCNR